MELLSGKKPWKVVYVCRLNPGSTFCYLPILGRPFINRMEERKMKKFLIKEKQLLNKIWGKIK